MASEGKAEGKVDYLWSLTAEKMPATSDSLEWDDYCTALASLTAQRSAAKPGDKVIFR